MPCPVLELELDRHSCIGGASVRWTSTSGTAARRGSGHLQYRLVASAEWGGAVYPGAGCYWVRQTLSTGRPQYIFMPLPNVMWPEAYCFCPVPPCMSVYASRNIVNAISCRVSSPNGALWDRDKRVTVGVRRSRSQWNEVCWKEHFLGF